MYSKCIHSANSSRCRIDNVLPEWIPEYKLMLGLSARPNYKPSFSLKTKDIYRELYTLWAYLLCLFCESSKCTYNFLHIIPGNKYNVHTLGMYLFEIK